MNIGKNLLYQTTKYGFYLKAVAALGIVCNLQVYFVSKCVIDVGLMWDSLIMYAWFYSFHYESFLVSVGDVSVAHLRHPRHGPQDLQHRCYGEHTALVGVVYPGVCYSCGALSERQLCCLV